MARAVERRSLRFATIDELLADIDRIVASERAGTLCRTGNWSVGQTFGHLASWINYGYEGFPPRARPPFFVRWILRLMKGRVLRDGMKPGVRIPMAPKADGTFGVEPMTTEEGERRLRAALARLKNREPAKHHSPAFGEMSDDERIALQLRHAELHLGFLHPGG